MFAAFTAAPFSSSAFTLSVWPLEDARCRLSISAVFLHGADALNHESNSLAWRRHAAGASYTSPYSPDYFRPMRI